MVNRRLVIGASTTAALVALSPMYAPLAMAGVTLSLTSNQTNVQAGQATQFTISASGTSGLSSSDSYSYHVFVTDSNGTVMNDLPFMQPTAGTNPMQTTPTTVTDMVYGAQTQQPGYVPISYPFSASVPSQTVSGEVYGSFTANLSSSSSFTLNPTDIGPYNVYTQLYDDTTGMTVGNAVYTPMNISAPSSPSLTLSPSSGSTTVPTGTLSQWSLSLPSGVDPSQLYYQIQLTNVDGTETQAPVIYFLVGNGSQAQIPTTMSPTEAVFTDDTLTSSDTSLPLGISFGQTGSFQVTVAAIDKSSGAVQGLASQTVSVVAPNVTGTVYESDGTTPANGVTLDIVPGSTPNSAPASTDITVPVGGSTEPAGTYQTYLNPGASGAEYTVQGLYIAGQYNALATPVTFTVNPGQATTVPAITEPVQSQITVTGTLTSADGTPMPYGQFQIDSGTQTVSSVTADANGNFSLQIPTGNYQINTIWGQDGFMDSLSSPIPFNVTSSTTTQNVIAPDLHSVTLVGADGSTPMANTNFEMLSTDTSSSLDISVQTGANGQFILPTTDGAYEIRRITDALGQETLPNPIPFTVSTSSPITNIVDPVANVAGTVYLDATKQTLAANGQVQIQADPTTANPSPNPVSILLGADGKFAVSLPQGTYEVQGVSDSQSNWQLFTPAQKVTVGSGVTSLTVAPPVQDAHFVVNNPDGSPVTGGSVEVLSAADYAAGNWNNAQWLPVNNGTADAQLPTGDYVVAGLGTSNWYQLDIPFSVDQTAAQPIDVTVQPPQNDVVFNVEDAQGNAISQGNLVVLSQTDFDNQNWQNAYNFNISNGQAAGYLPKGDTYVVVGLGTSTGWIPLKQTFSVSKDLADGTTVSENVAPAAPNVTFNVTSDGTTPVANGSLTVISADDLKAGNWANAVSVPVTNGTATAALDPGDYVATYLWTSNDSYQLSVPFTVTTSDTSQSPLVQPIAPQQPKIQGVVENAQGTPLSYATLMLMPSGSSDESQAIYLSADQNGHFTDLQVQPDGTMTEVLVPGQAYTLYGVWDQQGDWTQVNSPFDTTLADQPLTIKLPAPDLSGSVTVNGKSITNGYIAIGPADSTPWTNVSWVSIQNGSYTTSVPTGQYIVYGVQDTATNTFVNTQSISPKFSVDDTKSNTFDFTYTPNLSGQVTNNGLGVAYATVMLSPTQDPNSTQDGWNQVEYVTTDSQGNFEANVPEGSTWYIIGVYDQKGDYAQLDQAVQANPSTPVAVDMTPTVKGTVTWNQSPDYAWVVIQNTQTQQTFTTSLTNNNGSWSYGLSLGTGAYQVIGIITQSQTGASNWVDLSAQGITFNVTTSNTPLTEPINLSTSFDGTVRGNSGQAGYVVFSNASTGKLLSIPFDASGSFTTVFDGSAGWTVNGIQTAANGYQAATGSFANNTWTVTVQ